MMSRTRQRPLPSHRISFSAAAMIAFLESLSGSLILYYSAGRIALILGLTAMFWYNGVYTHLKRITANAVIPGSVIGSIPPLVGWVSAGGSLWSIQAGILAIFFFIWQVPHFYLLAIQYGQEYEEAGLPSITSHWSSAKVRKHIFVWIVITAIAAAVLAFSRLPASVISSVLIVISSLVLIYAFRTMRRIRDDLFNPFRYFMKINYFVLAVTLILVTGPFFYFAFHF